MTITSSAITRVEISETLSRIRELSNKAKTIGGSSVENVTPSRFNQVLDIAKESVSDINKSQLQTEALKHSYMTGDPNVSISQVMMSTMKSRLAFEGLLVVRNKLLDAYKEIMNMPV